MIPIKSKMIPAYEDTSSFTGRFTPPDIGVLLAKVPPKELHRSLDAFVLYKNMFGTEEVKQAAIDDLTTAVTDLQQPPTQ